MYRIVVGETGNEQGHIISIKATTLAGAFRRLRKELKPYSGDGWGYVEYQYPNGEWERMTTQGI